MNTLESITRAIKQGINVAAIENLITDHGQSQLALSRDKRGLSIVSTINQFNAISLGRLADITSEKLNKCFTQLIESPDGLEGIKLKSLDTLSEWRCKIDAVTSESEKNEHFTTLGNFAEHYDIAVAQLNAVNIAIADKRTQ
jgi:hypothetical protein